MNESERRFTDMVRKSSLSDLVRMESLIAGAISYYSQGAAPNAQEILDEIREEIRKRTDGPNNN